MDQPMEHSPSETTEKIPTGESGAQFESIAEKTEPAGEPASQTESAPTADSAPTAHSETTQPQKREVV